jgi:hypothetical protein
MSIMLTEGQDRHPHARALRARGQRLKRCDRRRLKRDFLRQYSRFETTKATCAHLGIARTTLYAWLQRDTHFADSYHAIINARFEAEMAALDRRYPEEAENYWSHASERQLIAAMGRMERRKSR